MRWIDYLCALRIYTVWLKGINRCDKIWSNKVCSFTETCFLVIGRVNELWSTENSPKIVQCDTLWEQDKISYPDKFGVTNIQFCQNEYISGYLSVSKSLLIRIK